MNFSVHPMAAPFRCDMKPEDYPVTSSTISPGAHSYPEGMGGNPQKVKHLSVHCQLINAPQRSTGPLTACLPFGNNISHLTLPMVKLTCSSTGYEIRILNMSLYYKNYLVARCGSFNISSCLISALRRQRQADLWESRNSLTHTVSSRKARAAY
ncbi:hypothetical protein I79_016970 [Cricetulus griseus]|uniref:Uncharacterized protein n=1 Tax=Cricetulus griseus TaxID=10029 RepID=G3I0T1_CRIGR|nr:hypothetical protein I79_016970 [Cricetulus griseus]